MSKEAKKQVIEAALNIAEGVAGGQVDADDVTRAALQACRELAGTVIGPEDPLWPMQVDVARQVLALDGIPGNELDEWAAVVKRDRPAPQVSWIEQALAAGADEDDEGGPAYVDSGLGYCDAVRVVPRSEAELRDPDAELRARVRALTIRPTEGGKR